jgi:uncharacterized protein (DUF58 family)
MVLGLLVMAFLGISTTTGTGWPIVLVSLQLGVLVAAFGLPAVPLSRAQVAVRTPADATAGLPLTVELTTTAGAGVRASMPTLDAGWFRLGTGELMVVPEHRGVVGHVLVELRCASPLGLWPWRRRLVVPLEHVLCVAPRPVDVTLLLDADALHRGDELTRGVRPYTAGDALRDVHWPATARTGAMHVREREQHQRSRVHLVVDLGLPDALTAARVEERASWAAGAGLEILGGGREMVLHTNQAGALVSAPVRNRIELGRHLAKAGAGPVARPTDGIVVDVSEVDP